MKRLLLLLVFCAYCLPAFASGISDLDVSGITLGTPVTKGKDLIDHTARGYTIIERKNPFGYEGLVVTKTEFPPLAAKLPPEQAQKMAILSGPDHIVVLAQEGDVVTFVGRGQLFEEGKRPTVQNTVAALTEKYGTPSVAWNGHSAVWAFDREGFLQESFDICQRRSGSVTSTAVLLKNLSKI